MKHKDRGRWVLWKHKTEDVVPMKHKDRGRWVLWNIKTRTLSPMKHKDEDAKSYET